WVATFGDVTKYMREREAAKVNSTQSGGKIAVTLTHTLDKSMYDLPLTLKTYVPASWKMAKVQQGKRVHNERIVKDDKGGYVLYQAEPNGSAVILSKA
ncbi:MAG: polysaccharide deacetylase family protein, partial [Bacteroidetes bacterium]|nr:polysaccharide deacetylase family protein [Bacteroidota bacterium]